MDLTRTILPPEFTTLTHAHTSTMALTRALAVMAFLALGLADQQSCRDVGFSSSLLCSSCDELKQFSLSILEKDCRRCCQQDKDDTVASKVTI